jgi:hypothetical protein
MLKIEPAATAATPLRRSDHVTACRQRAVRPPEQRAGARDGSARPGLIQPVGPSHPDRRPSTGRLVLPDLQLQFVEALHER